jgi:hypothetical protein
MSLTITNDREVFLPCILYPIRKSMLKGKSHTILSTSHPVHARDIFLSKEL